MWIWPYRVRSKVGSKRIQEDNIFDFYLYFCILTLSIYTKRGQLNIDVRKIISQLNQYQVKLILKYNKLVNVYDQVRYNYLMYIKNYL